MHSRSIVAVNVSAGSRSVSFLFLARPTPAELLEALEQVEGYDDKVFKSAIERINKGEYAALPRTLWLNESDST